MTVVRVRSINTKYENVPNDFEALITVDLDGLVVDFPELFTRTAYIESKYDLSAASRLASMMQSERELSS
jgi:hypothetical protein